MPNIDSYLAKIREAVFGEEVRGSIHDALAVMNGNIDTSSQVALRSSIADAWSSGSAYPIDSYVWYTTASGSTALESGFLYRSKQAVPMGTAPTNTTYWEKVDLSDEIFRNAEAIIKVQNSQPTERINKIWIKDRENEVTVPTYEEYVNSIATEYSNSSTYRIGDYTIYEGKLYKCNTNISTPEEWNSSHWNSSKIAEDFRKLEDDYDYRAKSSDYRYLESYDSVSSVTATGQQGILQPDNTVLSSTGYRASATVTEGDVYKISGRQFSNYVAAYYLRNNGYIVHVGWISVGYFDNYTVSIPSGVDEIVVNLNSSLGVNGAIKKANKISTVDLKSKIDNVDTEYNKVIGSVYDYVATKLPELSGVMNAAGGIVDDGSTTHSEVDLSSETTVVIAGRQISGWFPLGIFLNGNAVVGTIIASSAGIISHYEAAVPQGANRLVINGNNAAIYQVLSKKYAAQDYDWITQTIEPIPGVISSDGNTGNIGHHLEIPVNPGDHCKISGKKWSDYYPGYVITDGTSVISTGQPEAEYFTDVEITIPDNGYMLYINGNAKVGLKCIKYERLNYSGRIKNLRSKTMVWFGTSIPQNTQYFEGANWSIPTYAGKILGMNVINECYGASIAARGIYNQITENDPYGWTGVSWYAVFRALGANLTEKQDLIDNYVSKWYALLGGSTDPLYVNAKPTTLTDALKAEIKSCSYENRLIPYLNGTKPMPDLFIFEHGYNDSQATVFSGISPDESNLNRSLYSDAMYFFFKKIFEANSQAKILVVSHYENTSATGKKTFDAQKELAEYHGVYFCDVADNIGWSQRLVTTTGYWDDGIWVPSGGTERTITRLAQCIPDQVHPHTDKSGNAVKREAQIIADYIAANINLD